MKVLVQVGVVFIFVFMTYFVAVADDEGGLGEVPTQTAFSCGNMTYDAATSKFSVSGTADQQTMPIIQHQWYRSWTNTWTNAQPLLTTSSDTFSAALDTSATHTIASTEYVTIKVWIDGQPGTAIIRTYIHP